MIHQSSLVSDAPYTLPIQFSRIILPLTRAHWGGECIPSLRLRFIIISARTTSFLAYVSTPLQTLLVCQDASRRDPHMPVVSNLALRPTTRSCDLSSQQF